MTDSPLLESLLEGVTEHDITEALGSREGDEGQQAAPEAAPRPGLESTVKPPRWDDVVSKSAYALIVTWETGGKAYYENVIKSRPVWPAFSSGITIGCGWDLGYHTLAEFRKDWATRIGRSDFDRLALTIGFKTTQPNRAQKVIKARQLVLALKDITVPWATAIEQFDAAKLPKLLGQLYDALDHLDRLHPHCRGALLSLLFNRGPFAYAASGDRFREMRGIRDAMQRGRPADFRGIPALIRSMKRIWGATSSLGKRRETEAKLFEEGLQEASLMESLVAEVAEASADFPPARESHVAEAEQTDLEGVEGGGAESPMVLEAAPVPVKWNPNDDDQPDYRHLPKLAASDGFEFTPQDLDALIAFNAFDIKPGRIVFALRGAAIIGADEREDVAALMLKSQRPDHVAYRCVIGAYDPVKKKLWAYKASTVPNAHWVRRCHLDSRAGTPLGSLQGNILPTGCYTYTIGTHRAGSPTLEIRGVLRLNEKVLVLRSLQDAMYSIRDTWHATTPGDNIHPGRRLNDFSSQGCLTLPGSYDMAAHTHSGLWRKLRSALGLGASSPAGDNGRQFSTVLLTGQDAALASALRESGDIQKPEPASAALRRLRFGSKSAAVERLQKAVKITDPDGELGPVTRERLALLQQKKLGWSDAIYAPEMDGLLGLDVLGPDLVG